MTAERQALVAQGLVLRVLPLWTGRLVLAYWASKAVLGVADWAGGVLGVAL